MLEGLTSVLCAVLLTAWIWFLRWVILAGMSLLPAAWQLALLKPRQWWWPFRFVGWCYAYLILVAATLICVLITSLVVLAVLGGRL